MVIIHCATPTLSTQHVFDTHDEKRRWLQENDNPFFKEIDLNDNPYLHGKEVEVIDDRGRISFIVDEKAYNHNKFFEKFWY